MRRLRSTAHHHWQRSCRDRLEFRLSGLRSLQHQRLKIFLGCDSGVVKSNYEFTMPPSSLYNYTAPTCSFSARHSLLLLPRPWLRITRRQDYPMCALVRFCFQRRAPLYNWQPNILRTISQRRVSWLRPVLRRPDDHSSISVIYQFNRPSADWKITSRQTTQPLGGRGASGRPAGQSSAGEYSDTLPRQPELEGQGGPRGLNTYMS